MNRSTLLLACAVAFTAVSTLAASFKEDVGLQLYSLRDQFNKDVPGTLPKVKAFGIKKVELAGTYNLAPEKLVALLKLNGLDPVSGHFPYDRYEKEPEAVAAEASALGLKYAGCAWITHKGDFDQAQARKAAAVFNRAGEALAKKGIKFFYHCHGFEFAPIEIGSRACIGSSQTRRPDRASDGGCRRE